jgi:hypothetical protein
MRFGFFFLLAVPCVVFSHPHGMLNLTHEQIELARTIFAQFQADPTDPGAFLSNTKLVERLKELFGSFSEDQLTELFLEIFYDDSDSTSGDSSSEEFAAQDEKGSNVEKTDRLDQVERAPSTLPSDIPSISPSTLVSDIPSIAPFAFRSDIPSVIPFTLQSNIRSVAPSSMPSDIPSDRPSTLPSDVPSSTPIEREDPPDPHIKGLPKNFMICPNLERFPSNFKKAPKLTIMYGYRLEIEEDAKMKEVIKAVDEKITLHLLESVCGDDQALAVSVEPDDTPGGENETS